MFKKSQNGFPIKVLGNDGIKLSPVIPAKAGIHVAVILLALLLTVPAFAFPLGVLPDPALTPGAVDPAVTLANIMSTICVHGYTAKVRHVTAAEKRQDLARYLTAHPDWPKGPYEDDHDISLELGGSNDLANRWPEPYSGPLGARQKDQVENYLHRQVCAGKISLKAAQEAIKKWPEVYGEMKRGLK